MELKLIHKESIEEKIHEGNHEKDKPAKHVSFRPETIKVRDKIESLKEFNAKSESPVSVRLIKTTSKIVDQPPTPLEQISSTQSQIHQLIDELDFKLKSNYHLKESNLIETYRQELIQAHKDLIELKNNTNEQQIKNEMNEKFLEMKKERLELIQNNMFYSNKCIEYKKLLEEKVVEGKELEKEIEFLEKQINNSNQKKVQILSQLYENNSPLKNYQIEKSENSHSEIEGLHTLRKVSEIKNIGESTPYKKTSLSTHANTEVMKKVNSSSNSNTKPKATLLTKMPEINSQMKKIFEDKLIGNENFQTDRSNLSIKNPTILSKISALNSLTEEKKTNKKEKSEIEQLFLKSVDEIKQKRGSKKEISLFKCEEFTDIEKKEIMKSFLAKEDVKQYIYNAIFDKTDDSTLFSKKSVKEKFKIVAAPEQNDQELQ